VEGIFTVANMLALATETIETHPDLDHWELAKRSSNKFEFQEYVRAIYIWKHRSC